MTTADRARTYLGKLPHSIAGAGGHNALFDAALVVRKGFDLPDTVALDLLKEYNATHCDPPWPDRELRRKINEAAKANRPAGYLLSDRERNGTSTSTVQSDAEAMRKARRRSEWPTFRPLSDDTVREIAALRHLSLEAVHIAHAAGLLRGAVVDGHRCFILTEGTFAQARRLDGGKLKVPDGEAKAKNLLGSEGRFIGKALLGGQGVTGPAGPVLLVEGCIGLLEGIAAALAVDADAAGWTVLAATSSSSRFDAAWLDRLRGRRVRILPDPDKAGLEACGLWAGALRSVGCAVDAIALPDGHHDLGSLIRDINVHRGALADIFTL